MFSFLFPIQLFSMWSFAMIHREKLIDVIPVKKLHVFT